MSNQFVELQQQMNEIEEIMESIIELNKQKEKEKTQLNYTMNENHAVIEQSNIINYLYDALA